MSYIVTTSAGATLTTVADETESDASFNVALVFTCTAPEDVMLSLASEILALEDIRTTDVLEAESLISPIVAAALTSTATTETALSDDSDTVDEAITAILL